MKFNQVILLIGLISCSMSYVFTQDNSEDDSLTSLMKKLTPEETDEYIKLLESYGSLLDLMSNNAEQSSEQISNGIFKRERNTPFFTNKCKLMKDFHFFYTKKVSLINF